MDLSSNTNPLMMLYRLATTGGNYCDDGASYLKVTAPVNVPELGGPRELLNRLMKAPSGVVSQLVLKFGRQHIADFNTDSPANWFDWTSIEDSDLCDECRGNFEELKTLFEELESGLPQPNISGAALSFVEDLAQCVTCQLKTSITVAIEKTAAVNHFLIDGVVSKIAKISPLVWLNAERMFAAFDTFAEFSDFMQQKAERPIVAFFYEPTQEYKGRYFKILPLTTSGDPLELNESLRTEIATFDSDTISAYRMLVTDLKEEERTGVVERFNVPPALFLRCDGELASYPAHPLFAEGLLRSFVTYSVVTWLAKSRVKIGNEITYTFSAEGPENLEVVLEFMTNDVRQQGQSVFGDPAWATIIGRLGRDIEQSAGSEFAREYWTTAFQNFLSLDFRPAIFFKTLEEVRQMVETKRRTPPPAMSLLPDLSLYVHLDTVNKRLNFNLGFLNPNLGLNIALGETASAKEDLSIDELDQMARRNLTATLVVDPKNSSRKIPSLKSLKTKGESVWDDLIPDRLKEEFIKLAQREDLNLLIFSEDRSFPWELIKPKEYSESSEIAPQGFEEDWWAIRYGIGRWSPGKFAPANEITIARVLCVAASSDLSSAKVEVDYFDSLKNFGVTVDQPQTNDDLMNLLGSHDYDLIHFACHGDFKTDDPGESAIQLPDGTLLHPDDLRDDRIIPKLAANRPLVFLNCCHSGRTGSTLVGVAGWAKRFVEWGCGAFIGCGWEVADHLAADFAVSFYENFRSGKISLGQSIRKARQKIRERSIKEERPENSTWLAYYLYGNPNCQYREVK